MKKMLAPFLVLFVLSLNSCTKKEVKELEEFSAPEKTYRLWVETAEKGDVPGNMRCITEASKRIMEPQLRQMDEFMRRMTDNVRVFKTYTVSEQKSKEDRGVVVLKGKKGDIMVIPLKRELEGWKIDLISLLSGTR